MNKTLDNSFLEVVQMIRDTRKHAYQAVNAALIELHWQVGGYISQKIETAVWGEGVVNQLAEYIANSHPDIRGFTRRNLFRMRQFYETYRSDLSLVNLIRELTWTHNLLIIGKCKLRDG